MGEHFEDDDDPARERILVTGALGLVGARVTRHLRSLGASVVTHARRRAPGVDWEADLADPMLVTPDFTAGLTGVIHCAAAIPSRSSAFERDNSAAARQLAALLEGAPRLRRLVHISSVSVFRRPCSGLWHITEDAETVDVEDPSTEAYARSKRSVELTFDALGFCRPGLSVTHLRASSIYGPGMMSSTLLPVLIGKARRNEPLLLRGSRGYVQNFVHAGDVAELAGALAIDPATTPSHVNAFSDDTFGLRPLAELIRTVLDSTSPIVDETDETIVPTPTFPNELGKTYHAHFRSLEHHLAEAA